MRLLGGKWQLEITGVQHCMHHGLEGLKQTFSQEEIILQKVGQAVLPLSVLCIGHKGKVWS